MTPTILVVTGASGSGKTATVQALAARALPGLFCYFFDSIGVPSPEEMQRQGGGEYWQALTTQKWLKRLASDPDKAEIYVLDGQVRPTFVYDAAEEVSMKVPHVVLFDCEPNVRHTRLRKLRQQPELVNAQMDCWAAYLRGQADALRLPVVDTTSMEISDALEALIRLIKRARESQRNTL